MKSSDIKVQWVRIPTSPFTRLQALDEKSITYWAALSRWPLSASVLLSMGLNPQITSKVSGKLLNLPEPDPALMDDLDLRIDLVNEACSNGSLFVDPVAIPYTGFGEPAVEYDVDAKFFIEWARKNFESNDDNVFDQLLGAGHKNSSSVRAGKEGSKAKRALLNRIEDLARAELDNECKCQNNELAKHLRSMKQGDEYVVLEERTSRLGNRPTHKVFLEAVTDVFVERNIPTRFEIKPPGQERGKKLCERHRDLT